ncbi:MAG: hypothetical protein J6U44_05635 [Paludibacteraceae bacterium]|nr:hypothetical protein [Paludibacteraceae bacterium]MBO7316625.1 hypothetical protein [Paludibacteraceae bacterium]
MNITKMKIVALFAMVFIMAVELKAVNYSFEETNSNIDQSTSVQGDNSDFSSTGSALPSSLSLEPFADSGEEVSFSGPARLPSGDGHEEPWTPISDGLFVLLAFALGYVGVLRSKRRN